MHDYGAHIFKWDENITYIWKLGKLWPNSNSLPQFYLTEDDADNASGDGNEDYDEGDAKAEYVKKEYFAKPYTCTTWALEEVE